MWPIECSCFGRNQDHWNTNAFKNKHKTFFFLFRLDLVYVVNYSIFLICYCSFFFSLFILFHFQCGSMKKKKRWNLFEFEQSWNWMRFAIDAISKRQIHNFHLFFGAYLILIMTSPALTFKKVMRNMVDGGLHIVAWFAQICFNKNIYTKWPSGWIIMIFMISRFWFNFDIILNKNRLSSLILHLLHIDSSVCFCFDWFCKFIKHRFAKMCAQRESN